MITGFVGRRSELYVLEKLCSTVEAEERPAAALISGLPGSGKTRLLAELRSRRGETRHLSIVGFETATQVPLAAAADLLRELGDVDGAGAMLRQLLFSSISTTDRPLEPLRIFEAARRALLGVDGLILLIMDDLQWVDELSLALCSYLVRSAETEHKGLAVIACSRPATAAAMFGDSLIKELGPDRAKTLELRPLERDDGVELVRQLAPQLSQQRAAELWSEASGSPFWIGLLARSDENVGIADFLAVRRRELRSDASRLLALLAVGTRPLTGSELAAVMGWESSRVEVALADLERSGLATVQGIEVRIVHDLIRASVTADLSAARRRELHGLLAAWLEEQAGADAQLLQESLVHRREAGLDVTALALGVLDSPRRRLLGPDGLTELARIADSAELVEPVATALRLSVARLASELGEQSIALDRWTALATSSSDPTLRARAYLAASRAALRINERRDEAFPLLELARGQGTDDAVLTVELESHRANLLQVVKHRAEEGRVAAFHAADTARQLWGERPIEITSPERDAYVAALQVAFDSAVVEEDGAAQLRIAEEIAEVARGSEEGAIWADHDLAAALMFVGRVGEAVDAGKRAWTQARERMLPMLMLTAGANLLSKLIEAGRLGEADEVVTECLELERRAAGGAERFAMAKVGNWSIHDLRHQVWLSRGDWRDAIASLEREVRTQPDPHFRMHLHWQILVWLARMWRSDATSRTRPPRRRQPARRQRRRMPALRARVEAEGGRSICTSGAS